MSVRKEEMNSKPLENGSTTPNAPPVRPNPTISPKRLPSFKPPRDLTLGLSKTLSLASKPRKKFAPNVASRRNRANEAVDTKASEDNSRQGNRGKRGKWDSRGGGRGGQRNNRNFIQTTGSVFADGIGEATKRYHASEYHSHSRESSGGSITKTKLNLERHDKVDKKEEDLKLAELLSCNFVDDPGITPDENFRPISLPLIKDRKKIKKETAEDRIKLEGIKKEDDKEEIKIKSEPGWESTSYVPSNNCIDNKVVVKEEPDLDEEDKVVPKVKKTATLQLRGPNEYSVEELIEHSKKGYILFQLPTCLPGQKPDVESSGKPRSNQPSTSEAPSAESLDGVSRKLEECTLRNLPEGHLGVMRVYESGRSEMCLNGGYSLVVNPGTQVGFLQELVSVDINETRTNGKMLVLGPVCSTLNCTPDLEKMILAAGDGNS